MGKVPKGRLQFVPELQGILAYVFRALELSFGHTVCRRGTMDGGSVGDVVHQALVIALLNWESEFLEGGML